MHSLASCCLLSSSHESFHKNFYTVKIYVEAVFVHPTKICCCGYRYQDVNVRRRCAASVYSTVQHVCIFYTACHQQSQHLLILCSDFSCWNVSPCQQQMVLCFAEVWSIVSDFVIRRFVNGSTSSTLYCKQVLQSASWIFWGAKPVLCLVAEWWAYVKIYLSVNLYHWLYGVIPVLHVAAQCFWQLLQILLDAG